MAFKKFPRRRPRKGYKKVAKVARRRSGLTSAVKKYVKKTIHSNIENKVTKLSSATNIVTSYANNTALLTLSMIPYGNIAQGAGAGDRIGNTIKTRRCMFNFVLRPNGYNGTNNALPTPQDVLIFFGKVKNSKPQQPISSDYAKIWQNGDSYQGFQSNTLDLIQDVNKDWFTVYKVYKFKVGVSSYNGTGSQAGNQYYNNNDYKYNVIKRLNITKMCPKTIKFNDTISQPTNDGLWMWATCVNADGSINSTAPMLMDYTISYVWEDA
nr:MAG: capsid protein [Cressdnaviricota sp.]